MVRRLLLTACLAWIVAATAWAAGRDTYTLIISLDGLRWDYLDAYDVPFFDQMAREGVKAVMQPSFPSKTFPSHHSWLHPGTYPGGQPHPRQSGKATSIHPRRK